MYGGLFAKQVTVCTLLLVGNNSYSGQANILKYHSHVPTSIILLSLFVKIYHLTMLTSSIFLHETTGRSRMRWRVNFLKHTYEGKMCGLRAKVEQQIRFF